jgi:hypothetical protein
MRSSTWATPLSARRVVTSMKGGDIDEVRLVAMAAAIIFTWSGRL